MFTASALVSGPAQVPLHVYRYSEAAFAVATVLNLLNMVFEETDDRKMLGLLNAVIKARVAALYFQPRRDPAHSTASLADDPGARTARACCARLA